MPPIRVKDFMRDNARIIVFSMGVLKMTSHQVAAMLDPNREDRRDIIATLTERIFERYR